MAFCVSPPCIQPSPVRSFPAKCRRQRLSGAVVFAQAKLAGGSTSTSAKRDSQTASTAPHKLFVKAFEVHLAAKIGVGAVVLVFLASRVFSKKIRSGSVSELIRRGQLRSDRKSDLRPLKYDDPFNNPLVNMKSKNPLVRMCGKLFRLTPVTLTEEKVANHQNRRVQAYQWRRPIVFLNEGDPVPEGVDPDEVRWIPSNHPFATTSDYIDEEAAQKNIYQTRGVPARVRAEHEALRRKMKESSDGDEVFNKLSEESFPQAGLDKSTLDSGSLSDQDGKSR